MRSLQTKDSQDSGANGRRKNAATASSRVGQSVLSGLAMGLVLGTVTMAQAQESKDPLLDLMIQKGMVTRDEADKVRAQADALLTNSPALKMPLPESKWVISKAVKDIGLFGDVRLRYEQRDASTPVGDRLERDRARVAVRLGIRGDLYDDFYFGLRADTSSNPRSPWVTLGSSSPGPFGKSANGISVGQAYAGWRPESWVDVTIGKMPNPLMSTPLVWDPDLNPEGAAEKFKYKIGKADFFANFGQFLYQDNNPSYLSGSLVQAGISDPSQKNSNDNTFLLAWQLGVDYHFTPEISAKIAASIYNYVGMATNAFAAGAGNTYIGEGSYGGAGSGAPINGLASQGVSYNQVGVNDLTVIDIPLEVNFKIAGLNARVFGDYAYNLNGNQRAIAARDALRDISAPLGYNPPLVAAGAQTHAVYAYQAGFAIGNGESLGLVNGSVAKRHTWEARTYWQHVEQYALDPNLLDSDFFEGRGNMEGIYGAFGYCFTDNAIATIRYGYGNRINQNLGTGGSNLDLPELNPIQRFHILQLDFTVKF